MSRLELQLPYLWRPRPYQVPLWQYLIGGGKRAVAVWHRRAGKDDVALHWTACAAMMRAGNYWHMLPEASQARKAIWEAVNPHTGRRRIDEAFPREIRSGAARDSDMSIRLVSGSTWQVLGSDNFNSLVGSPPIGLVFSEYGVSRESARAWEYLRPILRENGGWALFIYTPRYDQPHGRELYETALRLQGDGWFCQLLTADDTGNRHLVEAERREGMPEELIRQEYYCCWDSVGSEDWQVIPGAWIREAQARWTSDPPGEMDVLGLDVARGGRDKTVATPRHGRWFGQQAVADGAQTPDGAVAAAFALAHLRDGAVISVDVVGVGSSVYDHLRSNGLDVVAVNGAEGTQALDASGKFRFSNRRSEMWWRMREALNPIGGQRLALPRCELLAMDLAAPRWRLLPAGGIQVESKHHSEDQAHGFSIVKRLGRSPDRGDSAVLALLPSVKRSVYAQAWRATAISDYDILE